MRAPDCWKLPCLGAPVIIEDDNVLGFVLGLPIDGNPHLCKAAAKQP